MENNVTKKSWPPYLILGLISLIAALILALTNAITAGPIAEHKMAALQETFSAVMPAASYEEVSFSSSAYSNVSSIYAAKDENGNIIGYCVTASQQGYAGPVAVTFGMDPAGSVVATKVGDTDFQETTGIGAKALNPEFAEQFTGLNAAEGGSFEAISGATFTSKAILGDANGAFGAMADAVLGKAGGEVVFGKREAAAAAPVDASALTPGATLKGEAQGFGGKVTVTVTLDDNTNIGSLAVDAPDETEGLGKLAQESAFTDQFAGKSIPVALEDISAVSGATITTTAVVEAINSAAPAAAEILPGATLEGSAQGFGGPVSVKVKLDDSLQIESLSVKAPDETEGLGKMAEESSFTDQFAGKSIPVALEDISAVSGATITTTAVVNAINSAVPVEAEGALTVDELSSITEGSVGLQSNGLAVVSADSNYSGTLVGEFQYENGQLVNASIATPAPAVEEPAAEPAAEAADVLTATKPGYDNLDVTVSLTKAADGTVGSLIVDASTQTPGLGQRCAEEAFTSQFVGKTAPFVLGENVDAVASATLTSTAVVDAVNELMAGAPAAEEPAAEAAETLTATKPGYDNLDVTVSLTKAADGTVGSLTVDASTQTPGLGQRCAEEAFTSQFVGKTAPFVLGENVDAVASATLTSTAVVDAVNELMAGAPAAEEPAAEPAAEAVEALTATKPGYDNLDVTVSLTKAADGTVASLTVDASTQTPGLGQRCAEEAFTSQFVGKTAPFVLGENVDAVASATLTSTAVVDAVNELMAGAPAAEEPAAEPAAEEPAAEAAETLTATKPGYDNLDVTVSLTKAADGTVASLTVDASTQTPGLGQRCAEEAFTSQFVGKTAPFVLGENVDAVASATLTSTAVVDAVNELMAGAPAAEEPAAEPAAEELSAEAAETLTATKPGYDNLDVTVSLTKAADGTVGSLTVDASTQTPGLGQRCAEEAFTSQFVGKTAPFVLGENVDAVASATLTSTAVVDAVNELMTGAPAAEEPAAEPAAEEPAVEEPAPEVTAVPADLGEVYSITKPGFGELPLTVSITKSDDGTVTSLTVDASIQTAGIGDRVADTAFTSQFIGKTGPFVLGENVDAMAGATISSAAVVDAVNELLAAPAGEAAVQETPVPEDLGEVYTITKPGFGELPVTVSLTKSDDGTVTSLTVDASVQTAGIGDRVADTAFTSQFVGKTGPFAIGENIDALAGATLTSSAVVEAVNELLGLLPEATEAPTPEPTAEPTPVPTAAPTAEPTQEPTAAPDPTEAPTATPAPTEAPIVPEVGEDGTLTATVPGFGGLPLVVSLKKAEDGTIAALTVDASAQTAGIGDRCSDEAFTGQFVGKTAPFAIGENIDAVAGATVTSTAIVKAVNALMDYTSGN